MGSSVKNLASNLRRLMDASSDLGSQAAVHRAGRRKGHTISQSTVQRAREGEVAIDLKRLDMLADIFGVEPWRLLVPNLGEPSRSGAATRAQPETSEAKPNNVVAISARGSARRKRSRDPE